MSLSDGSEERLLVNQWLEALGRDAGLSLRLDAQGLCAIGHVAQLDCAIEVPEGAGTLYLWAPLMPWHEGAHPGLADHCLSAHFLGLHTQGASFAIDREAGELVLWLARPLSSLDAARFAQLLVAFFETAADWRQRLEAFCREAAAPAMGAKPAPLMDAA